MKINQELVDKIVQRAKISSYGLTEEPRAMDIEQYNEKSIKDLALCLVSAFDVKYDLVSIFEAALEIFSNNTNMSITPKNKDEYTESFSYQKLLKKYGLSDVGSWVVYSCSDPNAGLCGPSNIRVLGYFTGMLDDVINQALQIPGFQVYFEFGEIERIEIKEV